MTEPDEALLWAREDAAHLYDDDAPRVLAGEFDNWPDIKERVHVYRAGQAASAERIEALQEAIRRLLAASEPVEEYTHEVAVRLEEALTKARALLKEADQ